MKKNTFSKGFTLIELLVVIAIIGILASVVLVSLNSARQKGKDARIISDVQQARTALESGYNGVGYPDLDNNSTSGFIVGQASGNNASNWLNTGPQATALNATVNDAYSQGGGLNFYVAPAGAATGQNAYAIYGKLQSTTGYFCIDSTGRTNQAQSTAAAVLCL